MKTVVTQFTQELAAGKPVLLIKKPMNTAELSIFKNACAFSLTCRRMGNSRRGNMDKVEVEADKSRLKLTKKLIDSPEYDAIAKYQSDVYNYCKARTMPSFIRKGMDLVKVSAVEQIDAYLKARADELSSELVPDLVKAYPAQVQEAAKSLNGQFDLKNYPTCAELPALFRFEWDFLQFNVADNLPDAIRAVQSAKLEAKFAEAQELILSALRTAFSKLIDHAVDRLKFVPGEKEKTFTKTMVPNINEFIETFSFRNLMADDALEGLVLSASRVMKGVTTEQLRDSENIRERVAAKFEEIKATLDTMVVTKPTRKFDFEE